MKNWTQNEIELLKDPSVSLSYLHKKIPYRSLQAIGIKSSRLGYNRQGEALLRNSSNYRELIHDNKFCDIINGELLGDGCITKSKRGYYSFIYSTVNEQYCKFLHTIIAKKTNSKSRIYTCDSSDPHLNPLGKIVVNNKSYQFGISHKVFSLFYDKWYKNKKHIPLDLTLTPATCLHWYIGDGTIDNKKSITIKLATECFDKNDLEILIKKLSDINISAKLYLSYQDKFAIAIYAHNALKFLKYIGQCPVDSYKYKWNINGYRKIYKKCHCGKWFYFFSRIRTNKKYCCSLCRKRAKRQNHKENILTKEAAKLSSKYFYYILGHVLSSGKLVNKNIISIKILDKQLISLIRKKLHIKCDSRNTIYFRSNKLINLFKDLSIKLDSTKIPIKYHGDFLRGIFDASGLINLNQDNYYQIELRYKHVSSLCEMLGIKIEPNNIFRIKKKQRSIVFNKMYIHNNEIRSEKKYNLFFKSLNTTRKLIPKDEKGRFKRL